MLIAEFRLFERLLSFHLAIYSYSIYSTSINQIYTLFPSTNNMHYFHSAPVKEHTDLTVIFFKENIKKY